jgi:hypothetical protein
VRDVQRHRLGCRRGRRQLVRAAPGLEVAPVIAVRLESGRRLGRGYKVLRLPDQFLKAGGVTSEYLWACMSGFLSIDRVVRDSEAPRGGAAGSNLEFMGGEEVLRSGGVLEGGSYIASGAFMRSLSRFLSGNRIRCSRQAGSARKG